MARIRCAFNDKDGVIVEMSVCDDEVEGFSPDEWMALNGYVGWTDASLTDAKTRVLEAGDKYASGVVTKRFDVSKIV